MYFLWVHCFFEYYVRFFLISFAAHSCFAGVIGVTEIMEAEAEQASKDLLLELSEYCEKLGAPKPRTFVRKGVLHEELFNLIDKEVASIPFETNFVDVVPLGVTLN